MNFETLIKLQEHFADEQVCRDHLATLRWGVDGVPCCPFCGVVGAYSIEVGKRFKCKDKACGKKFSVTVGTIFENTKLPLRTWFAAMYLVCNSSKGISSHGAFPKGFLPDHIDGDSWNNRIGNLRPATPSQNSFNTRVSSKNTIGLKGVWFAKRDDKWMSKLTVNGRIVRLGCHVTKGLAAVARAKAAIRYHGEFARLT